MKRRAAVALFVVALIGVAILILVFFNGPREPVCRGQPITHWLDIVASASPSSAQFTNALAAAMELDTNALPWLLSELDARDSSLVRTVRQLAAALSLAQARYRGDSERRWHAVRGLAILGPKARAAVPVLADRLEQCREPYHDAAALAGIAGGYFPRGRYPVALFPVDPVERAPSLVRSNAPSRLELAQLRSEVLTHFARTITNSSAPVRCAIVVACGSISEDSQRVVTLLTGSLNDSSSVVRANSAKALGQVGKEPEMAVPALIAAIADSQDGVRAAAAGALASYRSQAKAAVPALQNALSDADPRVRTAAADALEKIATGPAAPKPEE